MNKFKIGDKVKLTINDRDISKILHYNKEVKHEIELCISAKETEIIDVIDLKYIGSFYLLKADNGATCWRENELKLVE